MKLTPCLRQFTTTTALLLTLAGRVFAADTTAPIAPPDLVFAETGGLVAFEAEHFVKQELTDVRAFHLTTATIRPGIAPDTDGTHVLGASGGAYLEILSDTRWTHNEPLIRGENFSNVPGKLAVLSYRIHFTNPGRYHVWARTYSTGTEDNGVHFGLNGEWPESGQRWQTTKKRAWHWDSRQRTNEVHGGVPGQLYLDIPTAGEHLIQISMREDGFEIDKVVLTKDPNYEPEGLGPEPRVHRSQLPPPFAVPAGYREAHAPTLPTGRRDFSGLSLNSQDFPIDGTGFYRDRGRWLAIHPEQHREASTRMRFGHPPGRYDITLHCVGEDDGQAEFDLSVDNKAVGTFVCPLSTEAFEEGARFNHTWRNVDIETSDSVEIRACVASADGREYSRARWIGLTFVPSQAVAAAIVPAAAD